MAYASFSKVAVVSAALSLFTPAAAHLFQCPNHETVWITPEGTQYGICDNTDYKNGGGSLAVHNCVPSTQECLKFCIKDSRCKKAVYDKKSQMCHLKNNDKTAEMDWADDNGFDVIHRDQGSELDDGTSIKTCPNTGAGYSSGKTFFTAADHADGEIFSPPYLFNDDGSAAPRPAISGLAQEAVSAGATLSFDVEGNVASFSLIRTGTVTHSVNSDQRRIPLKRFRAQNGKYTVTLPTDRGVLLPGYYYLFAISAKDVPSVAKSVHVVL
ncbi:hypothetical protein BN1723_003718 [Verticillium longisporum]|uniref:Apple domain-containing protein n=1 Tax=Verticillium longisporum TaxID=100787 RepID=A0A0G4MA18_VERLO|nr:hypothetical protein BN1723_003718 [Verticillium longisporum]